MIWWIIGYGLMGLFAMGIVVNVILAWKTVKRGYLSDVEQIGECKHEVVINRRNESKFTVIARGNTLIAIVWVIFMIMTWPVEFLRQVFLDLPDTIELYEAQRFKGEA